MSEKNWSDYTANTELKEGELPKLTFDFLFVTHNTYDDAKLIKEHLENTDIYAPEEISGGNPGIEEVFMQLSLGKLSVDEAVMALINLLGMEADEEEQEAFKDTYLYAELEAIHNSGKIILLADSVENEMSRELTRSLPKQLRSSVRKFRVGQFDETLTRELGSFFREYVRTAIVEREAAFIAKFKEKIKSLFNEQPELKKKTDLKVLITFGSTHTSLYHKMQKEFPASDFKRTFEEMPFRYDLGNELMRRFVFKKPISPEFIGQVILYYLIGQELEKRYGVEIDITKSLGFAIRKLTNGMSMESLEAVSAELGEGSSLDEALSQYGVVLPKSLEELKDLIKKESV